MTKILALSKKTQAILSMRIQDNLIPLVKVLKGRVDVWQAKKKISTVDILEGIYLEQKLNAYLENIVQTEQEIRPENKVLINQVPGRNIHQEIKAPTDQDLKRSIHQEVKVEDDQEPERNIHQEIVAFTN